LTYPRLIHDPEYDLGIREDFRDQLKQVNESLRDYKQLLSENAPQNTRIGDLNKERETVAKIEQSLDRISKFASDDEEWILRQQLHLQALAPERTADLSLYADEGPTGRGAG
jgi:hypothetical protein